MPSWRRIAKRIRVPLGFLFAALYVWLAAPTPLSILIGGGFVLLGLLIRAVASGHVRKNEDLTVSGPYSFTRNPLYLGSIVLAVGFVIASRSWILASIAAGMLVAVYVPVIRAEEEFLRARFPEFEDYARAVPRFLPRVTPYRSHPGTFSAGLYWRHREYNAAIGAALMMAALLAKVYFHIP